MHGLITKVIHEEDFANLLKHPVESIFCLTAPLMMPVQIFQAHLLKNMVTYMDAV